MEEHAGVVLWDLRATSMLVPSSNWEILMESGNESSSSNAIKFQSLKSPAPPVPENCSRERHHACTRAVSPSPSPMLYAMALYHIACCPPP